MPASLQKLLIISSDALLEIESRPGADEVFRLLSQLQRRGHRLLLTAAEPDHWFPTRGSVDIALDNQSRLQEKIQGFGGDLGGVYYVARSLLTQDRNRTGALQDILQRYLVTPQQCLLLSSSIPFLKAASALGIQTGEIETTGDGDSSLLLELQKI